MFLLLAPPLPIISRISSFDALNATSLFAERNNSFLDDRAQAQVLGQLVLVVFVIEIKEIFTTSQIQSIYTKRRSDLYNSYSVAAIRVAVSLLLSGFDK